ncbi:hypothetical protein PAXRUDRAFT_21244 [Paxillus rubicundulus Ve08.2h10]|uniref:Uncharacterized protein n=1 Tax=Paxillus rubicundulus Ve08.2h10 TaxID=930991 RepID=A0A0D0CQK4_9AGAM|nr:hypothetical protein PAXRUDRAFT_21244 [Paxillus rubicundulus Ve08.2h10]
MHLAAVAVLFCTASPYLYEEPVPTTTSPNSETHGTEARSLETVPENQTLEPNLESPSNLITSNESPDVDMVDTTDLQPSASLAIAGSAGSGAEAIPPQPVPPQPLPLPFSLPLLNQVTIQVVEPTVKLVLETIIKCMTESAQGASGSCHIEAEESEADEDDDEYSLETQEEARETWAKKLLACKDAFRKYLEEKEVKKCRKDSMLPKSAPPDSVHEFNATNDHPLTLSDLMIDWSSSLLAPGWNTEVVQLLTVDFQQKAEEWHLPFCHLHHMCREKQDGVKLVTTDITARKERRHKLNRMTTHKHGMLA